MIFNTLEDSVYEDLRNLLGFINNFCGEIGFKHFEVDEKKLVAILHIIRENFPHKDGIENANPFKKVAYFIVNFVAERPMQTSFPDTFTVNGKQMNEINNHQNAIIAYAIAVESLIDAELFNNGDKEPLILSEKIKVSLHSYVDIIDALSDATPVSHFRTISLLFEQLSYRANPKASYEVKI